MGGRGSSSFSGGASSGVSKEKIVATRSLISEREGSQQLVDETMDVFMAVNAEYGSVVADIQLATLGKGSRAMAYYDSDDNIAINEKYFNSAKMDAAYKIDVASGFHPSNGNKTALQAVVAHELGHKLTADIATKLSGQGFMGIDSASTNILKEALGKTKHKNIGTMKAKISGYATSSNAEAIAEAFSDVFCNGSKAAAESRAIVSVIDKYLK